MKDKQTTTLNERDSLQDMLDTEKRLLDLYAFAYREGGSKAIRRELMRHYQSVGEGQYDLFEQMSNLGYYRTQEAKEDEISQKAADFQKTLKELSAK